MKREPTLLTVHREGRRKYRCSSDHGGSRLRGTLGIANDFRRGASLVCLGYRGIWSHCIASLAAAGVGRRNNARLGYRILGELAYCDHPICSVFLATGRLYTRSANAFIATLVVPGRFHSPKNILLGDDFGPRHHSGCNRFSGSSCNAATVKKFGSSGSRVGDFGSF